jgi:hypothetical protein
MEHLRMRASRRKAILAIGTLALLLVVAFLLFRARADFKAIDAMAECSESDAGRTASPSKAYVATVFVRNCGATTGYVTHVNLRGAGDAFIPDGHGVIRAGEVISMDGNPRVALNWTDDADLEVVVFSRDRRSPINNSGLWNSVHVRVKE